MNVGVWMGVSLILSSIVWMIMLSTLNIKGKFMLVFLYKIFPLIGAIVTILCGSAILYNSLFLAGGNI